MIEPAISIEGLTKRYGRVAAVRGADVEVRRGEVFGLLGPNGAGKTTILECLAGLRRPDGGRLRVGGCDPRTDARALRRHVGIQLQAACSLPDTIRVAEAFALVWAWHGLKAAPEEMRRLGLSQLARRQYRELSTGQKRWLHLALAQTYGPEVLILDEPTAGLDVQSRVQLHGEIRAASLRGVTVLLATHDMA